MRVRFGQRYELFYNIYMRPMLFYLPFAVVYDRFTCRARGLSVASEPPRRKMCRPYPYAVCMHPSAEHAKGGHRQAMLHAVTALFVREDE